MQYVHLGRSGVKVSRFCLGTMNFGPETSEADSFAIMDRALELGINFFDTADVYGWKVGEGWTEQIVGRWFAQGGGRRERVVMATKVFGRMGEWPNQSRLSALHIRRACEDSLRRLQTDCIDLYQMHHVDRETPWEEIWQAMEQLVREGKVLYVGSSNFAGWHLAQAQELARSCHFLGLVSEQSLYNLNERTIELEVIPACEAYGIGLIPWSPLARGLLAGALEPAKVGRRADEDLKKSVEKYRSRLEAYEALCGQLGERPADVALAWLLHQKAVTAPIIGPRTMEQLNGAMRVLSLTLSQDTLKRLDDIFPGPGGPHQKPTPGDHGSTCHALRTLRYRNHCWTFTLTLVRERPWTGTREVRDEHGSRSEVRDVRNFEPRTSNFGSRLSRVGCLVSLVHLVDLVSFHQPKNQTAQTNQTTVFFC